MKLISTINVIEFLHAVSACHGDVFFHTPEGDILNLKSTLSQYIFAVIESKPALLETGDIICKDANDMIHLQNYLR
nr:hypothetical protein [uncultured Clostridium sp.]